MCLAFYSSTNNSHPAFRKSGIVFSASYHLPFKTWILKNVSGFYLPLFLNITPVALSEWSRTVSGEDFVWHLYFAVRKRYWIWWEKAGLRFLSPKEDRSWERFKSCLKGNTGIWNSPTECLPKQEGIWVLPFGSQTKKKSFLFLSFPIEQLLTFHTWPLL